MPRLHMAGRHTQLRRLGACAALAFAAGVGMAGIALASETGAERPLPSFIQQLDDDGKFDDCLNQELVAKGSKASAAPDLIKAKGLGAELLASVMQSGDSTEDAPELVAAASADDAAKVDAVYAYAARVQAGDTLGLQSVHILNQINLVRMKAQDSACVVPAHLVPGGDPVKEWAGQNKEAIMESLEQGRCLQAHVEAKSPAPNAIDKAVPAPLKQEIRAEVVRRAAQLPDTFGANAQLAETATLDELLMQFDMMASLSLEPKAMIVSSAFLSYYRNRFYGNPCPASDRVRVLADIPAQ